MTATNATKTGTFSVELDSRGNPDHGQDPDRPVFGVERETVHVSSFRQASEVCCAWIEDNFLGGGNWTGGDVRDVDGMLVANVSYNGKVWPA
jgi:hypothetical protein